MQIAKHTEEGIAIPVTRENEYLLHMARADLEVLFMSLDNIINNNPINGLQKSVISHLHAKLALAIVKK
jgi:hypothetical protein